MIDELKLDEEHADAIIDLGVEYEVISEDDRPESKKDKIEQAHEIVSFAIDAWTDDGVNPHNDDPDIDPNGVEQVQTILSVAGIEIDKDNEISFGDLPELEYEGGGEGDSGDDNGDETPFDINDIIEGYDDAKVNDIIEAFESGQLTQQDIERVQEYEESEGARAKILKFDASSAPSGEDGGEEGEQEIDLDNMDRKELAALCEQYAEDFPALAEIKTSAPRPLKAVRADIAEAFNSGEQSGEDGEGDSDGDGGEEAGEPFEGYDGAAVKDIKSAIEEAAGSDEGLSAEDVETIIAYEEANKNRSSLVKWLKELIEGSGDGDGDSEGDKELDAQADDAVARDDERDSRKSSADDEDFDPEDDDIPDLLPKGLARVFVKSTLESAEKEIAERGLEAPSDYEGDMPVLPDDITAVTHDDLSNLLLSFQAAHSTAVWAASIAQVWSDTYGEIAEYVESIALLDSDQSNDTKRKAEAKVDARAVFFRARHREYHNSYIRWRDEAKTIEGKIKVISRVGGFKDEDDDVADMKSSKASTAGTAKGSAKGTGKKLTLKR